MSLNHFSEHLANINYVQPSTNLRPVSGNVFKWLLVVNCEHTQESFPCTHVLVSHCTEEGTEGRALKVTTIYYQLPTHNPLPLQHPTTRKQVRNNAQEIWTSHYHLKSSDLLYAHTYIWYMTRNTSSAAYWVCDLQIAAQLSAYVRMDN